MFVVNLKRVKLKNYMFVRYVFNEQFKRLCGQQCKRQRRALVHLL